MSGVARDNGEIVRGALEAFNRGDFDAVGEFLHPEIEVIRLGGLPTVTGREAAFGLMLPDAFEFQEQAIDELRVEGNVVMISGPFHARGAGSGIELSRESHNVFWLEDGLIRRMGTYLERDQALEAAGFA
jgi:ketosteroid isomerase-like protein